MSAYNAAKTAPRAMASNSALSRLTVQHPEWAPWLALVQHALSHEEADLWHAAVPARPTPSTPTAPLLAGARLALSASIVDRFAQKLFTTAAASGTPAMATLATASDMKLDATKLFTVSLCPRVESIVELSKACGADQVAFHAVTALVALPFLHACHRRWASSLPESWVAGYCPLCGAWPTFAEVLGIERKRQHRCGRCGSAWYARLLTCTFCGEADHDQLASLVPAKNGAGGIVEACQRCRGYLKTFTRLQACPPAEVMLEDLATVELDIVALEQGYSRPSHQGYWLDVQVTDADGERSSAMP